MALAGNSGPAGIGRWSTVLVTFALLACSPADEQTEGQAASAVKRPDLELFTSLPIFWPEADISEMLAGDAKPHWARAALESRFDLVPLDRLTTIAGDRLLMAQPRALAPDENVALDEWVRSGGHVLILTDPMLTAHSRYSLGDRRRPEAIAMLSPILKRWGLELRYDPDTAGVREVRWGDSIVPVDAAGAFVAVNGGHDSHCAIMAGSLIARCAVGSGTALLVADAAFIEAGDHAGERGESVLLALLDAAFGPRPAD